MRLSFHRLPLKAQLVALISIAIASALLLACASFIFYDIRTFRESLLNNLSTQAQIIGANSASALLFQDAAAAQHTLSALSASPKIIMAGIYTLQGKPFALWHRDKGDDRPLPVVPRAGETSYSYVGDDLFLFHPIIIDGSLVGTVCIQSDARALSERLKRYMGISAGVLLMSFLVAAFLSIRLGSGVTGPILDLIRIANNISSEKDYSIRVEGGGSGEIRSLVDTFNGMLDQIQVRGEALQKSHEELEQRVKARTIELESVNKELEAFSYSVSHDLRAPLRHIVGFSKMLLEDAGTALSEDNRRYLDSICDSAKMMGTLIDDLLAFSRMSRSQLTKTIVPLDQLVQDVLKDFKPEMEGRVWAEGEVGRGASFYVSLPK